MNEIGIKWVFLYSKRRTKRHFGFLLLKFSMAHSSHFQRRRAACQIAQHINISMPNSLKLLCKSWLTIVKYINQLVNSVYVMLLWFSRSIMGLRDAHINCEPEICYWAVCSQTKSDLIASLSSVCFSNLQIYYSGTRIIEISVLSPSSMDIIAVAWYLVSAAEVRRKKVDYH